MIPKGEDAFLKSCIPETAARLGICSQQILGTSPALGDGANFLQRCLVCLTPK